MSSGKLRWQSWYARSRADSRPGKADAFLALEIARAVPETTSACKCGSLCGSLAHCHWWFGWLVRAFLPFRCSPRSSKEPRSGNPPPRQQAARPGSAREPGLQRVRQRCRTVTSIRLKMPSVRWSPATRMWVRRIRISASSPCAAKIGTTRSRCCEKRRNSSRRWRAFGSSADTASA